MRTSRMSKQAKASGYQLVAVLVVTIGLMGFVSNCRAGEPVKVFAAASLKNALDAVVQSWQSEFGDKSVSANYAASPALAKQIEQAAAADIFISADLEWMDYLDKKSLLKAGTRALLLGNRLVLIAPVDSTVTLELKPGVDLRGALSGGRLMMADVTAVPAGKYGKAALESLGLWASVQSSIASAENVRVALAFVARGEAPLGIVYSSDLRAEPKVRLVATFPQNTHPEIVYPAAILATSTNPDAETFLRYLQSEPAQKIFLTQGFTLLK
jgi:molybdate transport system substrate-binding protein